MSEKILIVVSELQNGGAQRVASRIAGGMADLGAEVHLMELFHPPVCFPLSGNVILHKMCENEQTYREMNQTERQKRIRQMVLEIAPNVILPFLDHVCQKVLLACVGTCYYKRIVTTLRNSPYEYSGVKRLVRDLFIRCSCQLVVQNSSQKAYFIKRKMNRVAVVPNPVDVPPKEHSYGRSLSKVIAVGRLNQQKNFNMLIRAFSMAAAHCEAELRIYGRGECEAELNALIKELGMETRIFLAGYSDDIGRIYAQSDLFVMSSDYEGMPNALMEAMAEGLPCISTDCETGPADLIESRKNGILVPIKNEKAMVDAIEQMLADPTTAINMGRCARETIRENYTLASVSQMWLDTFRSFGLL